MLRNALFLRSLVTCHYWICQYYLNMISLNQPQQFRSPNFTNNIFLGESSYTLNVLISMLWNFFPTCQEKINSAIITGFVMIALWKKYRVEKLLKWVSRSMPSTLQSDTTWWRVWCMRSRLRRWRICWRRWWQPGMQGESRWFHYSVLLLSPNPGLKH